MNKLLYSMVNTIYPQSQDFWEELPEHIEHREYKKNTILLMAGEVCREMYFLVTGFARAHQLNKNGEEITSWFMKEGDMIISVQSFLKQENSVETIELIEDTEVIAINHNALQYLYRKYPDFNFIGRVLTEHYYLLSEERNYSLRMLTAHQRYENLLTTHPEIFQRAQLKHIASYLGMQPETLSRVRAKRN